MSDFETSDLGRRQRLDEAMAEFLVDADAGRAPEREAFLTRYPDLRDELTAFLDDRANLERLVEPLRGSPGSPESTQRGSTEAGHHVTDPDRATGGRKAPAVEVTKDGHAGGDEDQHVDTVVRYFGDYELGKVLGRGGMGVVYKARQVSLNRPVALKMIRDAAFASDHDRRRFQYEAEAVAMLDHPGIVPIHEVGDHEGQRYFTMKLIAGASLSEVLASYRDDPRRAATLVAQVAEAVHHAHMRGILHRDLKPGNILVDADGNPHVTDFGLARKVDGDSEMTASGAIVGTPAYMAPEQASGRRGSITTATDVYGLGSVLYALFTGQAPFRGDSAVDTLSKVKDEPPEPPRKLNPKLPQDLEVICLKCLEKDPRRRYASARALADDLEHWLEGEPIAARRVGSAERLWLWCNRRPALAGLSAAIALLIAAGTATVIAVQSRANAALQANNAQLLRANERESAASAELREANERVHARFELAQEAIRAFQQGVNDDDMLKGKELEGLRSKLLKSAAGFYQKLEELLQSQTDRSSRAVLAQSYFELAELTSKIGDQSAALAVHRRGLAIRRELAAIAGSDRSARLDLAQSLIAVGALAGATGKRAEAISAFQESRELAEPLATGPGATALARQVLGNTYYSMGRVPAPITQVRERLTAAEAGLAIRRKLADLYPTVAEYRRALAASYESVGFLQMRLPVRSEPKEPFETAAEARRKSSRIDPNGRSIAMASFEKALLIERKLVEEHPEVTQFRNDLADSLQEAGVARSGPGKTDGLDLHRESLAIRRKLVEDNPAVTEFRSRLAMSLSSIGDLVGTTEALALKREELAIRRKLADDNPSVIDFRAALSASHYGLGRLLEQTGHLAEALESYQAQLGVGRKLAADLSSRGVVVNVASLQSRFAGTLLQVGDLQLKLGHQAEAMASYTEAVAIRRKLAEDRPADAKFRDDLADTHRKIGTVQLRAGRVAEAQASFEQAIEIRRKPVKGSDSDVQLRRELAATYDRIAVEQRQAGQVADALRTNRACLTLRRKLAEEHPEFARLGLELGRTYSGIGLTLAMAGRPAQAMASYQAALATTGSLMEAHPKDVEYRRDLADFHTQVGLLEWRTGRPADAIASFQASLAILRKLVDDNPAGAKRFASSIAHAHISMGRIRAAMGLAADALSEYQEAKAIYQSLADSNPASVSSRFARKSLADSQMYSADVLRWLGRLSEARAGYARAITTLEGPAPSDPEYADARSSLAYSVLGLGLVERATGDYAAAAAAARRALAIDEGLSDDPFLNDPFGLACVHSELAGLAGRPGSGIPAAQAGPEAGRAMALLFQAMAKHSLNPALMRTETALDPLRERNDFKLLMMDLAMPAEPFAD